MFRKQFFVSESFAHPAKMDAQLLIWIVEHYTQQGEIILDPMAGSGTTMLACTLGRNIVLIELEHKFCKMMTDNWIEVQMRPQLGSKMGGCQIIQGDARHLEGLVDKIVTSPPYAKAQEGAGLAKNPPASFRGVLKNFTQRQGDDINNISNLPYGQIDKIVTSPPYEEAMGEKHHSPRADKLAQEKSNPVTYTDRVDSIIKSPPYSETLDRFRNRESEFEKLGKLGIKINPESASNLVQEAQYSREPNNIGNLKSDSYLEAMLQVYQQCHKVLKPQGLMILVTKNFIRNQQVIRLDTDTIKLCEQAGFSYLERHYRKLPSQSFWRVIYHQKYPNVEQILNEDVLVFRK